MLPIAREILLASQRGGGRWQTGWYGIGSCLAICWLLAPAGAAAAEPIKLHQGNGHYFLFRQRRTILVTSSCPRRSFQGRAIDHDLHVVPRSLQLDSCPGGGQLHRAPVGDDDLFGVHRYGQIANGRQDRFAV